MPISDDLRDLYQQVILDHSRHPRNHGELGGDCIHVHGDNPTCGDQVKGKTAAEVKGLYDAFHHIVTTGEAPEEISDLAAFAGVHAFPARIKCATLGWHAVLNALAGDAAPATTETRAD